MAEELTQAQLIEQKLQLTQMELEASTSFEAISEMLLGIVLIIPRSFMFLSMCLSSIASLSPMPMFLKKWLASL